MLLQVKKPYKKAWVVMAFVETGLKVLSFTKHMSANRLYNNDFYLL